MAMLVTLTVIIILGSCLIKFTNATSKDDYSGTPSPEWIKYQEERHDPKYNSRSLYIPQGQGTSTPKPMDPKADDKISTNSSHLPKAKIEEDIPVDDLDLDEDNEFKSNDFFGTNESGLKIPSISGFIDFLKSLKRTWFKKSFFQMDKKIKFLSNLKENLMRAIEDQFFAIWPEADPDYFKNEGRHLRQKRGILGEANITFPPEAALLSINFLTFAVFLIKLVMQVVNIVKTKYVNLNAMNNTSQQMG